MKATFTILWLVTLAAAFGVGHRIASTSIGAQRPSAEAFRSAFDEPSELDRARGVTAYLHGLTREELPEALAVVNEQRFWLLESELRMIMLAWAGLDPAEMFASVQEWPERNRDAALTAAAYAWAFHDPQAALDAIGVAQIPDMDRALEDSAIAGWIARDDHTGLTEWIEALPEGTRRQRLTGSLVRRLLQRGPDELIAWADSVPEDANDGFKETVVLKAGNTLAQMDPLRAKNWIDGMLDKEYVQGVAPMIVRHWGAQDPMAAVLWSLEIPEGQDRDRAISSVFRGWFNLDPDAARTWLLANTPDPALDPALAILIQRSGRDEMEAALAWSDRIQRDEDREKVVVAMVSGWQQRDPDAAEAWLAQADLSDETRDKIDQRRMQMRRSGGMGAAMRKRIRGGGATTP